MTVLFDSEIVRVTNDEAIKALIVKLSGFAQAEKSGSYVDLFRQCASRVPVQEYSLIIDSGELKTFPPAVLPVLEESYQLYMSTGFKKVTLVNPKEGVARMQLSRVARKVGFTGNFVESLEEALDL